MTRVLIADDEMLSRTGIKVLIPWQEYGFELIGECDNGGKALEMAKQLQPDIIITDIRMPVLNGIELMCACREHGLQSRFIVLSSYDDFNYVKEAMRLGADDYLLKLEIEAEGLLNVLHASRAKFESEKSERARHDVLEKQFVAQSSVFRERFLMSLLQGLELGREELEQQLLLYSMPLEERNLVCLVIGYDGGDDLSETLETDKDLLEPSIINIIEEMLGHIGKGAVCRMRTGILAAVVSMPERNPKTLERFVDSLRNVLEHSLNVYVTTGISSFYDVYSNMRAAYLEALNCFKQRYGQDSGPNFKDTPDIAGLPLHDELGELDTSLRTLNSELIQRAFDGLVWRIAEYKELTRRQAVRIGHAFSYIISAFIKDHRYINKDFWEKYGENPYLQVEALKTGSELTVHVIGLRDYLFERIADLADESLLVIKAKQYIQARYADELSLKSVADHLGLSPNYFSRMFSKATNMTFIDYVIELRIEKAKELLKHSNLKVGEISELTGYDNPHYFSRIFKKVTGYTPSEFKSQI